MIKAMRWQRSPSCHPLLWMQRALEDKMFALSKVAGQANPADLGTKHVDRKTLEAHLTRFGCRMIRRKAELALNAAV